MLLFKLYHFKLDHFEQLIERVVLLQALHIVNSLEMMKAFSKRGFPAAFRGLVFKARKSNIVSNNVAAAVLAKSKNKSVFDVVAMSKSPVMPLAQFNVFKYFREIMFYFLRRPFRKS